MTVRAYQLIKEIENYIQGQETVVACMKQTDQVDH